MRRALRLAPVSIGGRRTSASACGGQASSVTSVALQRLVPRLRSRRAGCSRKTALPDGGGARAGQRLRVRTRQSQRQLHTGPAVPQAALLAQRRFARELRRGGTTRATSCEPRGVAHPREACCTPERRASSAALTRSGAARPRGAGSAAFRELGSRRGAGS